MKLAVLTLIACLFRADLVLLALIISPLALEVVRELRL